MADLQGSKTVGLRSKERDSNLSGQLRHHRVVYFLGLVYSAASQEKYRRVGRGAWTS